MYTLDAGPYQISEIQSTIYSEATQSSGKTNQMISTI